MDLVKFDFTALTGYYNAKINYNLASTLRSSGSSTAASESAEAAGSSSDLPWRREIDTEKALIAALGASSFLPNSVATAAKKENGDVAKILAAYEALAQVKLIADAALEGTLPAGQTERSEKRMLEGIAEVKDFLSSVDITKSTLITGERMSMAQSEIALSRSTYEYNTKVLHEGDYDAAVDAFAGNQVFTIDVKKINSTETVTIDLSEMQATTGETVRNLDNVADFINFKLEEAGLRTRFERVKIGTENEDGVIEGNQFGFQINGTSTETLSFSSADAEPAAILVGQSGSSGNSGGQLSVWSGLDGVDVVREAATRLGAEEADTIFNAAVEHPDGGYVVVGTTTGQIGDGETRGEQDAFLARYDSQGKLLWSRTIGAGTDAEGVGIAISDTGQIAITGKTKDDLTSNAIGGGDDTFVTMFDEDGIEQWTYQRAATFDDEGTSIAFTADGGVVIGGTTNSTLTENALAGGKDAFIQKIDASGNQVWTRQFGTAGNDSVGSLQVANDGSIIVAGIEDGEAVVRRYASDVDDAGDWSISLGNLNSGAISDIEIGSDGSVYVGGSTRSAGIDASGFTSATQVDRDGFVAKINVSGSTPSLDYISRLGGEGYQSVSALKLHGDQIIVAGTGESEFGNATSDKDQSAYMTSLSQVDGTQGWTKSLSGRGGVATASDVLISDTYSKTLDAFGLPDGDMVVSDTASLTDRLSLRAGDHFFVSVDGGRDQKITIEQGDNLRSLTFKINAALVLDGNASVKRGSDGQSLKIEPADGVLIELKSGAEGQDALSALGLTKGFLMENPALSGDSQNDAPEIVTMGLIDGLSFEDEESTQKAVDVLDGALRALRTAYRWAIDDPTLTQLKNGNDGPGKNSGGTPPAYLTAQIANLQAGLQRLNAGSGSTNFFA